MRTSNVPNDHADVDLGVAGKLVVSSLVNKDGTRKILVHRVQVELGNTCCSGDVSAFHQRTTQDSTGRQVRSPRPVPLSNKAMLWFCAGWYVRDALFAAGMLRLASQCRFDLRVGESHPVLFPG